MKRVFGYGSLVNRRTHGFATSIGRLDGWQRVWRTLPGRPMAILSAMPAPGTIEGLYLDVSPADEPDLDRREAEYDCIELPDGGFVYSIPEATTSQDNAPIIRSYLDVVLQGFERELGPDSLPDFIATTQSWERGIYDDRAAPLYPRAQTLSPEETARYDRLLASMPVIEKL